MIKIATFQIECLSRPNFDSDAFLRFLEINNQDWIKEANLTEGDSLIEAAGRVCYMSFGKDRQSGKSNTEYIMHLIRQGHESVLEHINWTFLLSGVSRAFTHQLVRHRVGFSYSQLSQQYHDESDASFVIPPALAACPKATMEWKNSIENSLSLYRKLISDVELDKHIGHESKKERLRDLRSACRSILPNATETKIVVTANARAIRHFFKMRGAIDGDWEMRAVACALFKQVQADAPGVFQDFRISVIKDGSEKLVHESF